MTMECFSSYLINVGCHDCMHVGSLSGQTPLVTRGNVAAARLPASILIHPRYLLFLMTKRSQWYRQPSLSLISSRDDKVLALFWHY